MAVVKSDAMLQYEKGIGDVISKRPKVRNDEVMHVEWSKILLVAAAVFAVIIAVYFNVKKYHSRPSGFHLFLQIILY